MKPAGNLSPRTTAVPSALPGLVTVSVYVTGVPATRLLA